MSQSEKSSSAHCEALYNFCVMYQAHYTGAFTPSTSPMSPSTVVYQGWYIQAGRKLAAELMTHISLRQEPLFAA